MISYKMENLNPKNKKTCDCVVRALTKATRKDYYQVYKELFDLSIKTGFMLNEKRVEEKFLEQNGFIKIKQPKKLNGTKYQAGEIDKLVKNGIVIIRVCGHLTCVVDNTLYDIWDCRSKTINNYYIKEEK